MKRLKVLISAYACEPGKGSEPGVGWNWVLQLAQHHEVWVITRANNRMAIEQITGSKPLPNIHWIYFDLPGWARFWKKGQRGIRLYYYLWQIGAYFLGKRFHDSIGFDIVHHVTFVTYWMPSFLSLLPVRFVWGPVGGGESTPKAMFEALSWKGKLYEVTRTVVRWLGEHNPFVRITARRAQLVLATSSETEQRLRLMGCRSIRILSQVALPIEEIEFLSKLQPSSSTPFRLISLGRLLQLKGFHLGLEAFAVFQQKFPDSEYWVIGDGPERNHLESLAKKLGVSNKVKFWGALSREEVFEKLANCHVLVHPSLHESGGWVCVEAMAAGRPVICLALGGTALQVTAETGYCISPHSHKQVVKDMAEAMYTLARNRELRKQMEKAARWRVREHFSWEKKGELMNRLYRDIMTGFLCFF
ncbi:MAG: glycosyltransferase family 1 protein [Calditrichaeota bacterium]|nr:MAG: glycosyltransferase family 1 protein [Calditrichota bacterium]